jgi:hypothetical protein
VESVNPAATGEDIPEHFARLVKQYDPGAYSNLEGREAAPSRYYSLDAFLDIEPFLQEFLEPYVEEAIMARPITVKIDDPDGMAERQRIIAYLGRRRTDGLHDSITLATLIAEIQRGDHLTLPSVRFDPPVTP